MSVNLVVLPGAPTLDEDLQKSDQELNTLIEEKTKSLLEENPKLPLFEIVAILQQLFKKRLPPGGGIESKYDFVFHLNRVQTCNIHHFFDPFLKSLDRQSLIHEITGKIRGENKDEQWESE
jgi:hypothetical protein